MDTQAVKSVAIIISRKKLSPFNKWILSDYELLGTQFERSRSPSLSGQPQTVNCWCAGNGLVPVSNDYKRLTKLLNPGMDDNMLAGMMDKWTPKGAKWHEGEEKVPTEIIFASNPIWAIGPMQNPGGLTGIPSEAQVYQVDALAYDGLWMFDDADDVPEKYVMHFTVNVNGANVVNPDNTLGGRYGLPVKLLMTSLQPIYLRAELLDDIDLRANRYSPPWEKGTI